jgi:hypothetical protein
MANKNKKNLKKTTSQTNKHPPEKQDSDTQSAVALKMKVWNSHK